MKVIVSSVGILLVALMASAAYSQERCFTPDEAVKAAGTVGSGIPPADLQKVRKELINLREQHEKLSSDILNDFAKGKARVPELNAMSRAHLLRVCEIIRQDGWIDHGVLRQDAYMALTFLITTTRAGDLQQQMVPLLVEASKKGEFDKPALAEIVDSIRLSAGLPQVFGTQATRRGDIIYILPLLNEGKVDEWRRAYNMPSLASNIRSLEAHYLLPVLKSQRLSGKGGSAAGAGDVRALGISDADESIKVETKAVNLNVILQPAKGQPLPGPLTKDDFTVFEDDTEQNVTFFSATESPVDVVLVLDFSGSTMDKRSLIKKAAQRFVQVSRADDRIAVVAFATDINLVSDLTSDKSKLYTSIDKIDLRGGSPVWDSLKFAYDNVIKHDPGRRTAIVFMTDGEDNASEITFADLMEVVRHGDTTVFPIYVNTLEARESQKDFVSKLGTKLHQSLTMLADESGGIAYKANDLKDLNGIYEQVITDIGKIYTLGYEPKNETRDGGWRNVEVKLPHSPGLTAKTRRGYYAN
jgi:VWFA-related protein